LIFDSKKSVGHTRKSLFIVYRISFNVQREMTSGVNQFLIRH